MKLISFELDGKDHLAILVEDKIYPVYELNPNIPNNMADFLKAGEEAMELAKEFDQRIKERPDSFNGYWLKNVKLLAPVPHPTSCRDGYAFRQHVMTARRNRGVDMIKEFDMYPIFYFTNHNGIIGSGDVPCMPDHFQKLDFELESAIVIGKRGRNIKAEDADSYIAGYMIMNDVSARVLQMDEMLLNLGPAKGKDFATAIGPWLVTPDELEPYKTTTKTNHIGAQYKLEMTCSVNGKEVSRGNMGDMDWTFAEIIERASYGADVFPGDVIGSGTVGTGCFLELNGTGLLNDKSYQPQWLKEGDEVVLEITGLGKLENKMVREDSNMSLIQGYKKA